MRRLPGILLLTVATLIVIVALLVSGLRLVLPTARRLASTAAGKISTLTGTSVDTSRITASWQTFGPTLDARDIHVRAERWRLAQWRSSALLALDVWRACCICAGSSAGLTFWQLQGPYQYPYSDQ